MQPSRPPMGQGHAQARTQSAGAAEALAGRASTLLQRILDVEHTLSAQEWWMLGRVMREAGVLAEVISLLAVARGELDDVLAQFFGRPRSLGDAGDVLPASPPRASDPEWVRANRDQATELLRMAAMALPPMRQYAQMLREGAERLNMPMAAIDAFGIVADRLGEAYETIATPPS
ncbi:MAG: hypothetical protein IVW57_02095 [Ktedonobacterales bacterium]|nr:hypothetical protein [Ktedonobacterales bacterium]